MGNKEEHILNKICQITESDAGVVFKSNGLKKIILSSVGGIKRDDKNLQTLLRSIASKKEPPAAYIKQLDAYKTFARQFGYKSFYKELFLEEKSSRYYLLLFSKKKMPASETIHSQIVPLINNFKKKISKPQILKQDKKPEQLLSESEIQQTIKETINSINTVLFSTSPDGSEFNFITEAVRTLFGFSPEEIYQNKYRVLKSIHESDFARFKEFINKLRNKEEAVVEYRMKDRYGKEHWVRHSANPIIKNDKVVRIVGVIQEITEEKEVQLRLESSEERFRLLIDTADDLIFILDGFGYFSMVNKNGAAALGLTPEEMLGKHFLEFIDKEDEVKIAEAFNKILNSSGITTFETIFLDRFDKGITFEISAKPMMTNGEVTGMLSFGRNITKRKLDEQKIKDLNYKLIEANRIILIERERARNKITVLEEVNKLKNEFISNVSHELRTPLASIVGFAETISSDSDLSRDTVHEFSNIILMEGKRLAKLINDILDFSQLESGEEELQKTSMNVVDVIDEVVKNLHELIVEKKLVISKEYPEEKITINADKERISKVLWNLITNAIKYTNSGGRISVIVQDYGKEIEIAVSDTGVGIPEKDLPNLFQKFNKVQKAGMQISGTGFGLVTAKQIIDLHKGFIKVRSQVNKGATFIIRLPK
ncbi:MAG: PAS domain-containing sensor histidine kinase [Ignavibacteriales bacterium]|nr:PAS domain-containing sensor histidine kinase [Ignavibacteriales bacterium]